jgi:hypothetical protein
MQSSHKGARLSGTHYYYLEAPGETEVLDWFRSQPHPPDEYPKDEGVLLHFRSFGGLTSDGSGGFDASKSPLVSLHLPCVRRGILWTVGEVHFVTQNLGALYPGLNALRRRFQRWLGPHEIVWERQREIEEGYGYFIEGGVKNIADRIYALPTGVAAHANGQYFVAKHDNDFVLDRICKKLALRGVSCA